MNGRIGQDIPQLPASYGKKRLNWKGKLAVVIIVFILLAVIVSMLLTAPEETTKSTVQETQVEEFRIIDSRLCLFVTPEFECVSKEDNVYERGDKIYVWTMIGNPEVFINENGDYRYGVYTETSATFGGENFRDYSSLNLDLNETLSSTQDEFIIYKSFKTLETFETGEYVVSIKFVDLVSDKEFTVEKEVVIT